jgi:hypothetical protein
MTQLDKLVQTYSVAQYSSEFKRLSALVKWNDEALCHRFYRGLKESIKNQMTHYDRPKDLNELIKIALNADAQIYERIKDQPRFFRTPNTIIKDNQAMDIDVISVKHNPITAEECQRRIDNKLCHYCADPNHHISTCPLKLATNQ